MMDFSKFKKLTIGGADLKQLFINGVQVWKSGYKNWVKYSTDADGVTIYNGGLGYKDGYRVRSGGVEGKHDQSTCTGFIPFKIGETLRISPSFFGQSSSNAINFYDGSHTNIGQITDSGIGYGICLGKESLYKTAKVNGVSTLTLTNSHDASIQYVRITHDINNGSLQSGADMIVTINEEIE